jgi:anti-sigma B factor antagonist
MPIQCTQEGARCRLQIVGDMTIYTAADLQQQLLDALMTGAELEVDLSQVSELDTAGVQQLLLAAREATRLGKTLRLLAPNAVTREVLELYHLEASLGALVVTPAQAAEASPAHDKASCQEALS